MDEPLISARGLEEKNIMKKSSAYKLAKAGLIPSYAVGPKLKGIRFRVSEILEALRRPKVSRKLKES